MLLTSSDTLTFSEYATPNALAKFSSEFFARLKMHEAPGVHEFYPVIIPPGAVAACSFSPAIPASTDGTLITPGEHIPSLSDLAKTVGQLERAFLSGMRSVLVVLHSGKESLYHFSKVTISCY